MDAVWSREFLIAVAGFLAPMALAAALVYRRMIKSDLRRTCSRVRVTEARVRRALEQAAPVADIPVLPAQPAAPAPLQSLQQPLANLRQCLVAFRSSIQESRSALGFLQECDRGFSLDLGRASQVMHHAFPK